MTWKNSRLRDPAARCARGVQETFALRNQRAQGMPGARCTGRLACKIAKKRTRAYRFSGGNPAFPAQWFYGLLRALLGDQACLTPSPALLIADLTPASGRRNHTTSPYANSAIVKGTAASTASRPALMTLRNAPLRDGTMRI